MGINDRHGHIAGDTCLKRVAATLAQVFRAEDGLFRWGGDEFLVVAPGLDLADKQKHKLGAERPSGVSRLSGIWQKQA